ncbi:MAG: hypothetical protein WB565_00600 [Acidimicrobiales bacterium]
MPKGALRLPDDRTTITELGTALGLLGDADPPTALARRPAELRISGDAWDRLGAAVASGRYPSELANAFANGAAFLHATDGLRDRPPLTIEWTGGRRSPGDEVAPIDLRIDHVYLISCKYESDIVANASPARVFDGLLATSGDWERRDWYEMVASDQLAALYRACIDATGLDGLPASPGECSSAQLATVRTALSRHRNYPDPLSRAAYRDLCQAVSTASAARWSERLAAPGVSPESMLWRLLRIGSAPYFVLGNDRRSGAPARLRIASPWDWRDQFELVAFTVAPASAGQPRVDWRCEYRVRRTGVLGSVAGHVEIRWSHGRFAHPPEAKVYLDTPMSELPGYHPLTGYDEPQLTLWQAEA